MANDLEYYLAQARRISEHREAGVEKEIRKLYKSMVKDLQQFMSETYVQYAEDDKLTFAMLQKAGYDARFLEEIEQRLNISTPKAHRELRQLVEVTYKAAYEGMVDCVAKAAGDLDTSFLGAIAITPEQAKAAVENPVSGLTLSDTLEKNRKEIIYSIKQTVGVGLMNGDRYSTMARRIAEHVDGDYKKAIRIARTEAHRVREAGNHDAAMQVDDALQKGTTGMRMVKVWRSMQDERVRPQRRRKGRRGWSTKMGRGPNHMILDGQIVLENEPFDLKDGAKAMAPGQSGVAGHDINCRCYASREMLTDAEYFEKIGKHFPGWKEKGAAYTLDNKFEDIDVDDFCKALEEYYRYIGHSESMIQEYTTNYRRMIESGRYKNLTIDEAFGRMRMGKSDKQFMLDKLNAGRTAATKVVSKTVPKVVPKAKDQPNAEIDKAKARIAKRMKDNGQLNDRQLKEFETLMADWSDDQVMIYDAFTRTKLKRNHYHESGGAYYPVSDSIRMNIDDNIKERHLGQSWTTAWHTKFHEEFHQIDYTLFKTAKSTPRINNTARTKAFKKAFESDIIKIAREHTSFKGKTLTALTRDPQAVSELARHLSRTYSTQKQKAQINLFTDGLGLITEDAFSPHKYGFWGHDSQYNQRGVNGAGKEVWASYGGCIMSNDKEQRAVLDNLMPETMKLMDEWFKLVVDECR